MYQFKKDLIVKQELGSTTYEKEKLYIAFIVENLDIASKTMTITPRTKTAQGENVHVANYGSATITDEVIMMNGELVDASGEKAGKHIKGQFEKLFNDIVIKPSENGLKFLKKIAFNGVTVGDYI